MVQGCRLNGRITGANWILRMRIATELLRCKKKMKQQNIMLVKIFSNKIENITVSNAFDLVQINEGQQQNNHRRRNKNIRYVRIISYNIIRWPAMINDHILYYNTITNCEQDGKLLVLSYTIYVNYRTSIRLFSIFFFFFVLLYNNTNVYYNT